MYFVDYLLYHVAAFTELDGHKGIGNRPTYESYQVLSDMDHKLRGRRKHKRRRKGKHKANSAASELTHELPQLDPVGEHSAYL